MKQILLAMLLGVGFSSYAQCDKKVVVTSSTTENVDDSGTVQRSVEEKTTVEFDTKTISVITGENQMQGTISKTTCEWKTPFKEGKSVIEASLTDPGGETRSVTITIEGKDGKVTFIAAVEGMDGRKVRLVVDKFEEKKS